jgi:integrase/recombinase XerD
MRSKGNKERCAILTDETVAVLRAWIRERQGQPQESLFPTSRGRPLTTRAFELRLDKHIATATRTCPTLSAKRITPHTLRHYVDGWVIWPAGAFPLVGVALGPVPAT